MTEEQKQDAAEVVDTRPLSVQSLEQRFGEAVLSTSEYRGDWTAVVSSAALHEVMAFLKNDPELGYVHLSDITAVDYLQMEEMRISLDNARFAIVYHLYSHKNASNPALRRLRVKTPVQERDASAPSIHDLWTGANWLEREVYDMFGIRFEGHPDLRRILMPDSFVHHPLRKDYPVKGRGEREYYDFEDEKPGQPTR